MASAQPEEVAHVLGADIVSFSLKSIEAQVSCVQQFHALLGEVIARSDPVMLDTGDGAWLLYSGSLIPALLDAEFLAARAQEIGLELRLGLHTGPVTKLQDANGRANAYGPGVNMAQRVMNAAAPGGLLVSSTTAEFACAYEGWKEKLVDLGSVSIKHDQELAVFAIVGLSGIRQDNPAGSPTATGQKRTPGFDRSAVPSGPVHPTIHLEALRQNRLLTLLVCLQTVALFGVICWLAYVQSGLQAHQDIDYVKPDKNTPVSVLQSQVEQTRRLMGR